MLSSFFSSSHHLIKFVLRFTSYVAISTIKLISRFLFIFYYIGYKDIVSVKQTHNNRIISLMCQMKTV